MMLQYRDNHRTITLETFGYIDGLNNFTFEYNNDERNETVFPGKYVRVYHCVLHFTFW